MEKNYLKEKREFFLVGNDIRPGILVLVNETDWELLDKEEADIKEGDKITFISTLHGG